MWLWQRVVQAFRPGQDSPDRPNRLAYYNIYDARMFFLVLVERAGRGEEIVVCKAGEPVAKLVRYRGELTRPGVIRLHVRIAEDAKPGDPG